MSDRTLFVVRVVALVNFALLGLGAWLLGGDAFNGKVDGGHYLLGTNGQFTEVSRSVWLYSYWHVVANFVTFALALLALGVIAVRGFISLLTDRQ